MCFKPEQTEDLSLTTLPSEQPTQETNHNTDKKAGNDRKIEREVFFLYRDIAGKFTYPTEQIRKPPKDYPSGDQEQPD